MWNDIVSSPSRRSFLPVVLLYAVSRLWGLTAIPAFVDESIHLLWSHDLREGLGQALSAGRLLQILACAMPVRWGPDPLWSARLVSVAMGGVALAAVHRVAVRLGGERAGFAAAVLYVACPFTLLYDRMALADVFCSAFASLTLLACLRAVEAPGPAGRVGLGLAMAGAMLSKLTALFVLAWPLCCLLGVPRPARLARAWAVAYALAALLVAPALAYFLLTTTEIEQMAFTGGGLGDRLALLARNVRLAGGWLWAYWTPPIAVLALAKVLSAPWRNDWRPVAALATAALVPVLSLGLVAGEWFPRYVLPATPPALVLAALALRDLATALSRFWPRWPRVGRGLLLALACGPALAFDATLFIDPFRAPLPSLDREQYLVGWPSGYGFPEAAAYLRARAGPDRALDVVVDQLEQTGPLYALRAAFMRQPEVRVEAADLEVPQAGRLLLERARDHPCFVVVSAERLQPARAPTLAALPLDAGRSFRRPDGSLAVRVFRVTPAGPVSLPPR
jgi:hypothetical protein